MMGYSLKSSGSFMYTVAYPQFTATLSENPEALALANKLDPAAGEYMRPALEMVQKLIQNGCIDLAECGVNLVECHVFAWGDHSLGFSHAVETRR